MGSSGHQLHIFFFPFMAHGHMIPTLDMAKLCASRGVKATMVTTPLNATFFSKTIQKAKDLGIDINIQTIKFPAAEAGLPEGCEHTDSIISNENEAEMGEKFFMATTMLQEPLEKLLQEGRPDCLVADALFPWATDVAHKCGIPRIVFYPFSYFTLCVGDCIRLYEPHKKVSSDSESFLVPNLPGDIKFTKQQLPDFDRGNADNVLMNLVKESKEAELRSFGAVSNSFYELEPAYVEFYRNVLGKRAWNIGPLSLCNRDIEDKAGRGKEASIGEHECLKWLDSKKPNSVVYICFGSSTNFTASQLNEIAAGLEASGQQFIWVVSRNKNVQEDWLPEGFEERMEGKGLIIRGWAPQVLILDHEAIAGFVTHCGWNSTLEGITAGKPMITWPIFADNFYNEKLVTEVLKIGVAVGVKKSVPVVGDHVKSEAIKRAITQILLGEGAEEMRSRAKKLGEMARKAVEEGGSSYSQLNALIEELKSR